MLQVNTIYKMQQSSPVMLPNANMPFQNTKLTFDYLQNKNSQANPLAYVKVFSNKLIYLVKLSYRTLWKILQTKQKQNVSHIPKYIKHRYHMNDMPYCYQLSVLSNKKMLKTHITTILKSSQLLLKKTSATTPAQLPKADIQRACIVICWGKQIQN